MKIPAVVFSTLVCFASFAQSPSRILEWKMGTAGCDVIYAGGRAMRVYTDGHITLGVALPQVYDKHIQTLWVGVYNTDLSNVDADPAKFIAMANDSESTKLEPVDMTKLLAKRERSGSWGEAIGRGLTGFSNGMGSTATVQNSDGSYSNVTIHDQSEVNRANAESAAESRTRTQSVVGQDRSTLSHTFARNSVFAKSSATGNLYYEVPKKLGKNISIGTIDVPINGTTYRFPGLGKK